MKTIPKLSSHYRNRGAFTLVELAAVLTLIAVWACVLSPALARTRVNSKAVTCMNNMKQLTAAWSMYASDNYDQLAINNDGFHADPSGKFPVSWAGGVVDWSSLSANTNTLYLTDGRVSLLGSYVANSTNVFWCPTDTYLSQVQRARGWSRRIRSVAMDAAVGDGKKYTGFPWSSGFWWAKKMVDLTAPGPASSWVFLDEHPDSIDDCIVYTDPYNTTGTGQFTELPANDHGGGGGFAFADGHAEIHRWVNPATLMPVTYIAKGNVSVVNSKDLVWLASHTPHAP